MAPQRKKPARKPVKKATRKPSEPGKEKGLQYRCQQWLVKSGVWDRLLIFHVANERMGSIGAVIHFKRMGVRPGVADYLAFPAFGARAAIELKDADGVQDKDQEKFQAQWEASGGIYVVVRSLPEFQGAVNALLLFG